MNKIIVFSVIVAAFTANAGTWIPAGPNAEVHVVHDTPARQTLVGVNVLGVEANVGVTPRTETTVVAVQPVQGTVTTAVPVQQVPAQQVQYVADRGTAVTTYYPDGRVTTETPVRPAPVIVTEKVYIPGHHELRRNIVGRSYYHWVPGHYEYRQRTVYR